MAWTETISRRGDQHLSVLGLVRRMLEVCRYVLQKWRGGMRMWFTFMALPTHLIVWWSRLEKKKKRNMKNVILELIWSKRWIGTPQPENSSAHSSWRRYMETLPVLLAICKGNALVTKSGWWLGSEQPQSNTRVNHFQFTDTCMCN